MHFTHIAMTLMAGLALVVALPAIEARADAAADGRATGGDASAADAGAATAVAANGAMTDAGALEASPDDASDASDASDAASDAPLAADGAEEDAARDADDANADAAPATAAPPPREGPSNVGATIGLRAGYGVPFGTAKDSPVRDVIAGAFTLGFEVGYFLNPHFYLGGTLLYGFANGSTTATSTCSDPDYTCSATPIRFGVQARWHFRPNETIDPWGSAGVGYDIVNLTATDSSGNQVESGSLHGLELLNLQAGVDLKPKVFFGFGPFMELSMGHYSSASSSTSLHEWLTFGLRLRTGL